ncbi:MAG: hypothetical protein HYU77_13705 [Betaproteobacteria bacterium]|nr:hypothetical protein [Betaproteobacteria bacterium]
MTRDQVLAVLSRHVGAERGIHVEALVREVTGDLLPDPVAERRLRAIISELREEGIAVCGHPSTGYYIAETAEELEASCQFLRSRAMHSLVLEARLRKIPLPDLLGQLKLRT